MYSEWSEWQVTYEAEAATQSTDTQCEAFTEMNSSELQAASDAHKQLGEELSKQARAVGASEPFSQEAVHAAVYATMNLHTIQGGAKPESKDATAKVAAKGTIAEAFKGIELSSLSSETVSYTHLTLPTTPYV